MVELSKKENNIILKDKEYKYCGYSDIDSESIMINLNGLNIKLYWNDTTIDGQSFNSLNAIKSYLNANFIASTED